MATQFMYLTQYKITKVNGLMWPPLHIIYAIRSPPAGVILDLWLELLISSTHCELWSIPPLGRLSGDQYLLWDACLVINTLSGAPVVWLIDMNQTNSSVINCFIFVLRVFYILFISTQWECYTVEVWPRVCSNTVEVWPRVCSNTVEVWPRVCSNTVEVWPRVCSNTVEVWPRVCSNTVEVWPRVCSTQWRCRLYIQ